MKVFDIDQPATFRAEVTDAKGELVDPDDPIWRVLTPGGDLEEPTIEHVSLGIFEGEFDHSEKGVHTLLYRGEPPHKVGKEISWRVSKPKVPRD